jgi:hypothetical protein
LRAVDALVDDKLGEGAPDVGSAGISVAIAAAVFDVADDDRTDDAEEDPVGTTCGKDVDTGDGCAWSDDWRRVVPRVDA